MCWLDDGSKSVDCAKWSRLVALHVRDNAVDELVIVC